jgi:hypothetical protein
MRGTDARAHSDDRRISNRLNNPHEPESMPLWRYRTQSSKTVALLV